MWNCGQDARHIGGQLSEKCPLISKETDSSLQVWSTVAGGRITVVATEKSDSSLQVWSTVVGGKITVVATEESDRSF